MRTLNWFDAGQATTVDSIRYVENTTGVEFPKDFFDFVLKYSGASNPDESEFIIEVLNGRERIGNFGSVLMIDGDHHDSVLGAIANLAEQVPAGVVPVIGTGSGDYICLDSRSPQATSISYLYHERSGEDAIVPLAKTFTDFLEKLREPDDAQA